MNLFKLSGIVGIGMAIIAAVCPSQTATAQNLQSVSGYSSSHDRLLASQAHIKDQIKVDELQRNASQFYEDIEPEPDIYTEGWQSGLVNSYKNAIVPNTKKIDVRNFCMPVGNIRITSPYGYRARFRRMHKGIDLGLRTGDTIYAAFSGKVRLTKYERSGYGFYVIIRHENGLETVYGHLSRFLVRPDQYVKAGTPIALGGSTGHSTGPHLHFETRFMGYAINPQGIFDFNNETTHTDYYTFDKRTYENARSYSPDYSPANKFRSARSLRSVTEQSETASSSYKVRNGDSLFSIAKDNDITVKQLCKLNNITERSPITPGKVLRLR